VALLPFHREIVICDVIVKLEGFEVLNFKKKIV
jgi:hypothetical protein